MSLLKLLLWKSLQAWPYPTTVDEHTGVHCLEITISVKNMHAASQHCLKPHSHITEDEVSARTTSQQLTLDQATKSNLRHCFGPKLENCRGKPNDSSALFLEHSRKRNTSMGMLQYFVQFFGLHLTLLKEPQGEVKTFHCNILFSVAEWFFIKSFFFFFLTRCQKQK